MSAKALSLSEFGAKLDKYSKETMQLIAKDAAITVFKTVAAQILQTTPVLTGKARGNWIPSIGSPSDASSENVYGGDTTGDPLTGTEQSTLNQVCDDFRKSEETTIWFFNNLPYINRLDHGYSKKAPAGILLPSITASLDLLKDKQTKI